MPIPVFKSLRKKVLENKNVDWEKFHLFWLDDRFVAHDHEDSNFKLCYDHFLRNIEKINYYPIPFGSDIDECSLSYERIIFKNINKNSNGVPSFDMILIGVGDDGHIASLFPNSSQLNYAGNKKIITVPSSPFKHQRITFTIELINNAKRRIIGIKGSKKIKIFNHLKLGLKNNYPLKHLFDSNSDDYWVICKK